MINRLEQPHSAFLKTTEGNSSEFGSVAHEFQTKSAEARLQTEVYLKLQEGICAIDTDRTSSTHTKPRESSQPIQTEIDPYESYLNQHTASKALAVEE